mgnify:CR=1 FL=1
MLLCSQTKIKRMLTLYAHIASVSNRGSVVDLLLAPLRFGEMPLLMLADHVDLSIRRGATVACTVKITNRLSTAGLAG